MTDKELRKLSRLELLEVMIGQSKEMETLQMQYEKACAEIESQKSQLAAAQEQMEHQNAQVETLKEQLQKADTQLKTVKRKLEDRQISINQSGSIAEAALQLNGVFEAAQNAAEQYLENMMKKCAKLERETLEKCRLQEKNTQQKCEETLQYAREKIDKYWQTLIVQRDELYASTPGLKEIMGDD